MPETYLQRAHGRKVDESRNVAHFRQPQARRGAVKHSLDHANHTASPQQDLSPTALDDVIRRGDDATLAGSLQRSFREQALCFCACEDFSPDTFRVQAAEQMKNIPFDIARVYWTYDVPSGERRGGHAHRTCEEIVIAVSGSFDVTVDDGRGGKEVYHLNHPYQGLYIGTGVWRTLEDFSSGAVCLVLASELFDEDEYIYDYEEFVSCVGRLSK